MIKEWIRWSCVAATLLAALLGVSEAQAGSRIVLLEFSGRKAKVLREKVAESLERAGHSVVRSKSWSGKVSKAQIRKLAKRSDADAVVGGRVVRRNMKSWSLALSVNDATGRAPLGKDIKFESTWLPGLTKELTDNVSDSVEAALEGSVPPQRAVARSEVWNADDDALAESKAAASPEESAPEAALESSSAEADGTLFEKDAEVIEDRGEGDASAAEPSGMVVRLRARGGLVHRSLDFSDDIYDRLRKQQANIWVFQVEGELYPFERPIGERLGIIASYESAFSGSVRDSDFGANYPVFFQEFFGGIRARHPLGQHELGFDLTFGRMRAGLDDVDGVADIPDMEYTVLRSSLDFKIDLGALRAVGSAGFRLPLGFGEVSEVDWFPRIGGYGVEASAGLDYPLSKAVSLELTGALRRYLLEMNSEPDDAIQGVSEVAGGAVDLYLAGYFGMSIKL